MASILERYSGRQCERKPVGKPFKENEMRGPAKTTRPVSLKKSSDRLRLRLLVFVESSDGCRSSIFDSERCRAPKLSRSAPGGLQAAAKLDNEMRMVFGSFPMKISNNTAIKVHSLKSSNKAMISNVFTYYDNSRLETCLCANDEDKSAAGSPVSLSLASGTIAIKKPSLASSSIQSCSFNACNGNGRAQLHSLSSSVPTGMFYGSYAGMYKRLMRSVSNSLISDSTTVQNASIVESNEDLNFEFGAAANFDAKNDPNEAERRSLSAYSNNGSVCMHQSLCEKCVSSSQMRIKLFMVYGGEVWSKNC
ncbi:hypothetical protein BpHYR1_010411 [Brachionus plicatilis]|uniref:Uncharacterized protein n=1 Tax=Brachionus plicatilis TaxID=10195 RepID=A0A3M7T2Y8_BRAPC|nr:hypothetical protein BpHYR1_010411 [Brachionus plicatilis]